MLSTVPWKSHLKKVFIIMFVWFSSISICFYVVNWALKIPFGKSDLRFYFLHCTYQLCHFTYLLCCCGWGVSLFHSGFWISPTVCFLWKRLWQSLSWLCKDSSVVTRRWVVKLGSVSMALLWEVWRNYG